MTSRSRAVIPPLNNSSRKAPTNELVNRGGSIKKHARSILDIVVVAGVAVESMGIRLTFGRWYGPMSPRRRWNSDRVFSTNVSSAAPR